MVEADNGYRGENQYVRLPGHFVSWADFRAKVNARARHETVNRRFKQWGCLKQVYRHDIDFHSTFFAAVAVCTQLSLENGEPLYNVAY